MAAGVILRVANRRPTPYLRRRRLTTHRRRTCRLLLKRRRVTASPPPPARPLTRRRSFEARWRNVGVSLAASILAKCPGERAKTVEIVRLSGLSLTEISVDVGWRFISLRVVDLSDNQISSLAPLAPCCLLQRLDVASNTLSSFADIPNGAFRLLERLDVSYNLFTASELFGKGSLLGRLPRLQTLIADGNGLRRVPSLDGLFRDLRHLSLRHNALQIRDAATLAAIKTLKSLDLRGNRLPASARILGAASGVESATKPKNSRPPVFVPVPRDSTRRRAARCAAASAAKTPSLECVEEDETADARWRWREVDDPTVRVALRLGLDPSALHPQRQRVIQPAVALRQILAHDWSQRGATWTYLRPTVSSYTKQRFYGQL